MKGDRWDEEKMGEKDYMYLCLFDLLAPVGDAGRGLCKTFFYTLFLVEMCVRNELSLDINI